MFFEVIPTEIFRQGGGLLTYSSDLDLKPGQIVIVPLGNRQILGIVWKKVKSVTFPTKPVTKLLCPTPIPRHLLRAIIWLSDYYLSPLPAVANMVIPAGLAARTVTNELSQPISTPNRENFTAKSTKIAPIPLNTAQKTALRAIQSAGEGTVLLQGVTGSGKTNIYLKLAENALKSQNSAILLVPEIALTSQLVKIFESTFAGRTILIHSNQTLSERRATWLKLLKSPASAPFIVIGPRSALFSPLSNLGLIIIDESHEGAYYQDNTPHYSALRLASFMAKSLKIPCIQGTATPDITDFYLAKTHNSLVPLREKAKSTAIEPKITIIDLKDRQNFRRNRYFSDSLLTKIENNIKDKHQTLIFHNRRGSSPLTICENCGWQALCPECYLPMTLHADSYTLTCHICGHEEKVPSSCPSCRHPEIVHKGFGTKLLETELERFFPEARIARFDGDNDKKTSLAHLYQDVKAGNIDILIGTQTLARGLDLPLLATVGIVQADAGLSLPDFSAEERTFELLNQVIGRVGRGHLDTAEVIIQTYQPNHPVINAALKSNFDDFSNYLLSRRRAQTLPPFTYIARLSVTYKTEKTTLKHIQAAHAALIKISGLRVSPPIPAFHERTARGYTWQLILKSRSREALRRALIPFAKFQIELDPPSLL